MMFNRVALFSVVSILIISLLLWGGQNNKYDYLLEEISSNLEKDDRLVDFAIYDIDSDGGEEVLILKGHKGENHGRNIIIYDIEHKENKVNLMEIYKNDLTLIKPWKLEICNIDGDSEPEIFIAVQKTTRYYKELTNRPFFFNFKDGILVKKWTGSKVRYPFRDVYFKDINGNGRDEFIVIEKIDSGGYTIAIYYWFGFGFILQGESMVYDEIRLIDFEGTGDDFFIKAQVRKDKDLKSIILVPSKEKTDNGIYLLKERGL